MQVRGLTAPFGGKKQVGGGLVATSELSLASVPQLSSVVSDGRYSQALLAHSVLGNSDIPLLLTDTGLEIRFCTPAAASLFQLSGGQKAQPLEAIQAVLRDPALLADARLVLDGHEPIERIAATLDNRWYRRRIAAYRTAADACDGLIVSFADITDRERSIKELKAAKQQAEMTGAANMRRLSSVCHDLRQPLNTLGLVGGLLSQSFKDPLAQRLAQLIDESLQAMSGMLSSASYSCRLSAGSLRPDLCAFSLDDVFSQLRREFAYHSGAYGLKLRVVSSTLAVRSDPALFAQMVRSVLDHLVRTSAEKILLGCRRRSDSVRIEFWRAKRPPDHGSTDNQPTGAVGPAGPEIAKKLADILSCRLRISLSPREPIFVIEVPSGRHPETNRTIGNHIPATGPSGVMEVMENAAMEDSRTQEQSTVFVIDDDDDVCTTLQEILQRPGLVVHTYSSAEAFLAAFVPQNQACLLVDANLVGMQGIQLIQHLNSLGCRPPTIMISGRGEIAVAVEAMKAGAIDFVEKPFSRSDLLTVVERALTEARDQHKGQTERQEVLANVAKLTTRQSQVLQLMLEGKSSKMIAAQLFMSQRTVESHRANVMKKMAAKSLPELARMMSVVKVDAFPARSPLQSDMRQLAKWPPATLTK
jgi:two-component system, chemotaxis family, CheB/CheR fusion protein